MRTTREASEPAAVVGGSIAALFRDAASLRNAVIHVDADFTGRADLVDFGCLRMWKVVCEGPICIDGRLVSKCDWKNGDDVHIMMLHAGSIQVNQFERGKVTLAEGDWCVMTQLGGFRAEARRPTTFTLLTIPGEHLRGVAEPLPRLSDRKLCTQTGSSRLFRRLTEALIEDAAELSNPSRISFGHALLQALRATILDLDTARRQSSQGTPHYFRICEVIENNIARTDLSVGFIAVRLNCSVRMVHAVFGRFNPKMTVARHIRERRLALCHTELSRTHGHERSVAEIAHKWGFVDPSYFSRVFRLHYKVSPSRIRTNGKSQCESDQPECARHRR